LCDLRALREELPQAALPDLSDLRHLLQVLGVRRLRESADTGYPEMRPVRRVQERGLLRLLAVWSLYAVAEPWGCALSAL
jgi:hypothetical protein